jgi:hypothetical protein
MKGQLSISAKLIVQMQPPKMHNMANLFHGWQFGRGKRAERKRTLI